MNVGDSVLRREYIRALRSLGRAHLLVRQMPDGYLDGLGLDADDVLYTSDADYRAAFRAAAKRGAATWALNAGEMQFSRFYAQDLAAALPLFRLARRSGGTSLALGISIRADGSPWRGILRTLLRRVGRVSWRDAPSRAWTGLGSVAADWAFAAGHPDASLSTDEERTILAVTMRGDRAAPSEAWADAVRALAAVHGLEIVVVSQVEVDTAPMAALAERLGARFVGMPSDVAHTAQEETVRALYRRSSAVVSDRLHALVMGATEGAIPVGLSDDGARKAERHFDVVGLRGVAVAVGDATPDAVDLSAAARARVRAAVAEGRAQLAALQAALVPSDADDTDRPLTVLQSTGAPDGRTRYVDQLLHDQPDDVRFTYFSWERAFAGDYDVFHVHWPDALLAASSGPRRWLNRSRFDRLLRVLADRDIPIVRTLHNLEPHEELAPIDRRLLERLDAQTSAFVRINDVTPLPGDRAGATILHGHYVDRFGAHPRSDTIPGRILNFGLMRRYKGVDRLIEVFQGDGHAATSLRLVGRVVDQDLGAIIDEAAAGDARITTELRFVDDDELVAEVSAAELVVLPYAEMHNSGTLLVTLSLGTPALVPRTPVNEAIAAEVGPGWVILYDGDLDVADLAAALGAVRSRPASAPDLSRRDWAQVTAGYAEVFRAAARRSSSVRA